MEKKLIRRATPALQLVIIIIIMHKEEMFTEIKEQIKG